MPEKRRSYPTAASSYDPLDARLGRTSGEPVETTKGKPVRSRPLRKKSDAARSRLRQGEVGRIVNAARALVEAHERRSPTSQYATLGEETALFELNFRLGAYRQSRGMKP